MKLNFSYRTELFRIELNWTVLNRTKLFQFSFKTVRMVQFFFFWFSSAVQFSLWFFAHLHLYLYGVYIWIFTK